jgi:hypothetical protein
MQIKQIYIETLISGFSHLIWLLMFILWLSDMNATKFSDLYTTTITISVGATALIASVIFGISFFLGSLANRILSDILSLFSKPLEQSILNKAREKNKEASFAADSSWLNKHFFLSMSSSGLLIFVLSLLLDCKYMSSTHSTIILIVGFPIVCATIIAFFTQRHDFQRKQEELK